MGRQDLLGGWVDEGGHTFAAVEPATGRQLAEVGSAAMDDVRRAVQRGSDAQQGWAATRSVVVSGWTEVSTHQQGIQLDDKSVGVWTTRDADDVCRLLDRRLEADPVRATVLGTIRLALDAAKAECWCAATRDGSAVAVRSDRRYPVVLDGVWPPSDLDELATAIASLPELAGVHGAVSAAEAVAARLPGMAVNSKAIRLHRLDILTAPADVPGRSRRAGISDRELLRHWYQAFHQEADPRGGDIDDAVDAALNTHGCWLWVDSTGVVASMATRRPIIAGCARVGPVYTPSRWRGKGYGSAVTAVATRDVLDDGGLPVLFTDLANQTSNDIYQRLGYYPVEDRLEIEFRSV
jgi:GNAT superfamily N-acetyltransferase